MMQFRVGQREFYSKFFAEQYSGDRMDQWLKGQKSPILCNFSSFCISPRVLAEECRTIAGYKAWRYLNIQHFQSFVCSLQTPTNPHKIAFQKNHTQHLNGKRRLPTNTFGKFLFLHRLIIFIESDSKVETLSHKGRCINRVRLARRQAPSHTCESSMIPSIH